MRALRGPAGSLLASVLVAALFGGAAMALPGHPFASLDRQAIERQGSQAGHGGETPAGAPIEGSRRGDGSPNDPGAQGHARAEQRGDGAPGRTHAQEPDKHAQRPDKHAQDPDEHAQDPDTHAQGPDDHAQVPDKHSDSGHNSGVPGEPAPASDGHASSGSPNA